MDERKRLEICCIKTQGKGGISIKRIRRWGKISNEIRSKRKKEKTQGKRSEEIRSKRKKEQTHGKGSKETITKGKKEQTQGKGSKVSKGIRRGEKGNRNKAKEKERKIQRKMNYFIVLIWSLATGKVFKPHCTQIVHTATSSYLLSWVQYERAPINL
jgi:hypothetical protein